jgi:hypothetical protein
MADNDLDVNSPLGNNFRNTVFGRKVMVRLTAIGRGEADAESMDVQDESEVVAEVETSVEEAAPVDAAPAGAEPGDAESVDVQDESEAIAEVETPVEEAAPADEASGDGASGAEETEA